MMSKSYTSWKMSEIRYLKENRMKSNEEIANAIGRSVMAVKGARNRYKITNGKDTRFKSGHTPWNLGKSYDIKGNHDSRYKPGNVPPNTKYDYAVTVRSDGKSGKKYKYIRLSKSNWVPLHRWVYEASFGPIPAGYSVTFIDGDSMNCHPDNLTLISRKDLLKKNHNRKKAAETMKRTWNYQKSLSCFGIDKPLVSQNRKRKKNDHKRTNHKSQVNWNQV